QVQPGVADGGELDVLVVLAADGVEAEEGEEQVRLDALGPRAVGEDEGRVDALEGALRHDDGDLLDLVVHGAATSSLSIRVARPARCSRAASGCPRSSRRSWPDPAGTAGTAPSR